MLSGCWHIPLIFIYMHALRDPLIIDSCQRDINKFVVISGMKKFAGAMLNSTCICGYNH